MAYLVLALGALLSVGGGLSIFHGAGIVEVERGWTGVIAGATSLTGGIVTIALGLILRALLDLRTRSLAEVLTRPDHAAKATALSPAAPAMPAPAAAVPVSPHPPAADPGLEDGLLAAFLAPQAEQIAIDTHAPSAVPSKARPEGTAGFEPLPAEPVAAKSRFKIGFRSAAIPVPAPVVEAPPPPHAMDDWLDRAFSSLDNEALAAPAEPAHPTAAHTEAASAAVPLADHHNDLLELERHPAGRMAAEAQVQEDWAHESRLQEIQATDAHAIEAERPATPLPEPTERTEPVAAPMAATAAPAPPAIQSAVIGRYEADGTSYVMFADGSIEAQSDAGVYRFSSMTELKAFIEGTG